MVTAGNASGINDGAAALLIGSEAAGQKYGLKPMAKSYQRRLRVLSHALWVQVRSKPLKAVARAGLTLDDMDIIEINEAFASQVLSCLKGLNVDFNDPRVNPNGGAIAVGHPLGASGARLALTVARELIRRKKKYAVVSLCIGVGQGLAMVIENVS